MLQELLILEGHEAVYSPFPIVSAQEALSEPYDLITLDLKMPEFEGEEVARLFQELGVTPPILVISGFLTPQIEEQLRQVGLHHFLPKPFVKQDLINMINTLLTTSV